MRGPLDDAMQAEDEGRRQAAAAEGEDRRRPPGGKPLVRLLQLLERSGYSDTAAAALAVAVSREDAAAYRDMAPEFTSAPGVAPAKPPGGRAAKPPAQPETQPAEEIARISAEVAERTGPPSGVGPQWRSLGPWTIPNGQTYGSSRINVAGRVSSLAIDPANPAHILAGAANGGVWESRDRGASWAPRTDYQRTLTVGAIAFDRMNPSRVYCGTGEGDWWSYLGNGVLRSTDGGATWSVLCTNPFVGDGFYDLVVDPANGQHLIAGTRGGLWVSNDGGATWTRRRNQTTWSIDIAPAGGGSAEILAACADGLYRSTNGGTSWTAVALSGTPASWSRLAVAIAPSNPGTAYVWGASGGVGYLLRRSGTTWSSVGAPPGVNVGQAWYDWFLAVSPDRDTQIYCGAIDVHRGELSGTTWSWTNVSSKSSGSSIHPDQHAIAFEPGAPGTVYIGNDGGVYRSADRGINWTHCNNGLQITEFEYLAQDWGSSRWLIGGTQDNGTERYTGSAVWDHAADGDGGDCGVNRQSPSTVFHTYYGMSPERSTAKGNFGSWTYLPPPVPAGEGSLFYPPFEASATSGDTVAIGGDALYVSRNNMTNWTRLAFPSAARSSAMFIPNPDAVYVGTTDGRIYRTNWNGASWSALTALTAPRANAYVSDLFVDPRNVNRIWMTSSTVGGGRVFRSDNAGSTWADRTGTLPALPINAIEIDPADANRIWVAADLGVYQTRDGGATWTDFANGLPNAYVGDLVFHPHARVLRAGTRNRGVWEIPVDGWMTQPACGVQWTGSLAANQQQTWFTHSWPATWHVVWTVMPTTPRPGAPQVSWKVQVERANAEYATYWITVKNLTPQPLSFEGRYCLLSRY